MITAAMQGRRIVCPKCRGSVTVPANYLSDPSPEVPARSPNQPSGGIIQTTGQTTRARQRAGSGPAGAVGLVFCGIGIAATLVVGAVTATKLEHALDTIPPEAEPLREAIGFLGMQYFGAGLATVAILGALMCVLVGLTGKR